MPRSRESEGGAAEGAGLGAPVVLIAEDEAGIAEVIGEVVAAAGYTPVIARDGAQALALARERRPALLITDLMMPILDGTGLVAALRREGAAPPVVAVTAAPALAARFAADAVLPKPFAFDALEALLARFLGA